MAELSEDNDDKAPRVRHVPINQWSPGIKLQWTPAQIQSALIRHQEGDFGPAAKLATAMLRDDELPSSLSVATNLIVGADLRLEPVEGDDGEADPASEKVAKEWEAEFNRINPPGEMAKMLDWFEMVGIAVGTYDWVRIDGKWNPRFRCLNPENLQFFDGEVDPQTGLNGVFRYRSRNGDEVVTPGDGKWVLWSGGRESWISCAIRALGEPVWFAKQATTRDLLRYCERHGLPIVLAKVPAFADVDDARQVLRDVRALGTDTTMTLPSHMTPETHPGVGFEMELLEAKDPSYEVFIRVLDRCDRKIKMHFLGTNTAELEGTAGSRATQDSGRSIMMQKAQERYNRVRSFVRDQMLAPLLPFMGTTVEPALIPTPVYLIEGDEDLRERAETMELFGKALMAIKSAGWDVKNIDSEARQYGLELEERPEPVMEPGGFGGDPGKPKRDPRANKAAQEKQAQETLDALSEPEGFEAGAEFIEGLVEVSAREAEALEAIDAEAMAELIESSTSAKDLEKRIAEHLSDDDPVLLASIFSKADTLSRFAGAASVAEDL